MWDFISNSDLGKLGLRIDQARMHHLLRLFLFLGCLFRFFLVCVWRIFEANVILPLIEPLHRNDIVPNSSLLWHKWT